MPAEAMFPENFKPEAAGTTCQKFGRCVCTNREGAEQAEDSLHLHKKFGSPLQAVHHFEETAKAWG